jgi:GTPase
MRAYVLHPDFRREGLSRSPAEALEEAMSLALALPDIEVLGGEIVRLPKPNAGLLFGSGKIAELDAKFKTDEVGLVLVDGPVTPVQQRNLEKEWGVKLLDRTGLILEIFSNRAATREGVLQVEMAALAYQRTRLVRAWTHLERQRGGFGFVGGPGETQIESDRRAIDDQLLRLKRRIEKVGKTRLLQRAARAKVPFPIVALVGYTNAGKSTLFNRLTGAGVLAEDMLFATLDPTMRGLVLPSKRKIILSDTVGFISELPTELVAAFRATLEEVLSADLILHIRDISHPSSEAQAEDVRRILKDLGVAIDTPIIEVWNKIDLTDTDLRESLLKDRGEDIHLVSALTGEGITGLLARLARALDQEKVDRQLALTFADGRRRAWLHERGVITSEDQTDTGWDIAVTWTPRQEKEWREL